MVIPSDGTQYKLAKMLRAAPDRFIREALLSDFGTLRGFVSDARLGLHFGPSGPIWADALGRLWRAFQGSVWRRLGLGGGPKCMLWAFLWGFLWGVLFGVLSGFPVVPGGVTVGL